MVNINILNGGNITITTGSSAPSTPPNGKVWFKTSASQETWSEEDADIIDGAFNNFNSKSSAVEVIIPNKDANGNDITSIEADAFALCTNLTIVKLPDSVTSIGGNAFYYCQNLTSVTIGSEIQGIGSEAFATSGNPVTLTIGKTVAEVKAMGTTDYDTETNVQYSSWGLPSGSTIVCTDGNITP